MDAARDIYGNVIGDPDAKIPEINIKFETVTVETKIRPLREAGMDFMIEKYLNRIAYYEAAMSYYDNYNIPQYHIHRNELVEAYEGLIRMMMKKIKKKHCEQR